MKINQIAGEELVKKTILGVQVALLFAVPALSAQAATVAVDCTKKASVNTALAKLDKSVANTAQITGVCAESVSIQGHKDLTILGLAGAGITGPSAEANTVSIGAGSRVTMQDLTISGGSQGVACDDRSTCRLLNVSVQQAVSTFGWAVSAQKQSSIDIYGPRSSGVSGNAGGGIGIFGNSSVNVGPLSGNGLDEGPTISGNTGNNGAQVQDGSFLRVDNAIISNNGAFGVSADRGAVVKVFGTAVTGNAASGFRVRASVAQIGSQGPFQATISGNSGFGVQIQQLGYATIQGSPGDNSPDLPVLIQGNTAGFSIVCQHTTSVALQFLVTLDKGTNCQ